MSPGCRHSVQVCAQDEVARRERNVRPAYLPPDALVCTDEITHSRLRLLLVPARGETSAAPSPSSFPAPRPRPRTRHNPRPPPSRCARCRASPSTSCGEICASAYGTTHSPRGRVSVFMQKETQVGTVVVCRATAMLIVCLFPCSGVVPSRDTPYARPAPARKARCGCPRAAPHASRSERGPGGATGRHDGPRRMTTEGARVVVACDRDRARTHAVLLPLDY